MKHFDDVRVHFPSEGRTKRASNEKEVVVGTPAGKKEVLRVKDFPPALAQARAVGEVVADGDNRSR